MELHELEVGDARAGAPRHRDAVARGDLGVGRLAVHLPGAAGRQQRRRGADRLPRRPPDRGSATPTARPSSISDGGGARVLDGVDARMRGGRAPTACRRWSRPVVSRACSTRRTLCAASRASASSPFGCAIEGRAPVHQLVRRRPARCSTRMRTASTIAQPVAGGQRVLRVQLRRCRRRRPRRRCRPARSRCCPRPSAALVSSSTSPDSASSSAARSAAIPLPTMRKSGEDRNGVRACERAGTPTVS